MLSRVYVFGFTSIEQSSSLDAAGALRSNVTSQPVTMPPPPPAFGSDVWKLMNEMWVVTLSGDSSQSPSCGAGATRGATMLDGSGVAPFTKCALTMTPPPPPSSPPQPITNTAAHSTHPCLIS